MLETATAELHANPSLLADKTVVLLDIAIGSQSRRSIRARGDRGRGRGDRDGPSGDARTLEALGASVHPVHPDAPDAPMPLH